MFVECLKIFEFTIPFVFCQDYLPFSLTESNRYKRLALAQLCALYLSLCTLRLCSRSPATLRPKRKHGIRTLVSNIFRKNCSGCCSIPREKRTQDFTCPGCRLQIRILRFLLLARSSRDHEEELFVILNSEKSLGVFSAQTSRTVSIQNRFVGDIQLSNFHSCGIFCMFGSHGNQRFAIRASGRLELVTRSACFA